MEWISRYKTWLVLGVVLVAFLAFAFKPKKVTISEYANPEMGSVKEVIEGTGSLTAAGVTAVYSPTKGIVKKIFVANGQNVKPNEILFEVTSSATEQEKATSYAGLLAAKVAVKTAENAKVSLQSQLEAARKAIIDATNASNKLNDNLSNQKNNPATNESYTDAEKLSIRSTLISATSSFKSIEGQYLAADDSIQSAKSALSEASVNYRNTRDSVTKSPIAGTIFNLKKNTGDAVGVLADGEPVLVLANLDQLTISFQVSEFNIGKISTGQETTITFDALPGSTIKGVVEGVDTLGNSNLGTVKYGVVIRLKPTMDELAKIRPAMTANLAITTDFKENVLTIPRSALKLSNGKSTVVKLNNGRATETEVKVGVMGADKVEIESGLNKEDQIKKVFLL